jgi:outer membrane lipoprotein-sorting protein
VSNGNSLVIKNQSGKAYFRYLLKQTSLRLILDKDLLIKKIEKLNGKLIDNKYYVYYLENEGNQINIFFDKNSYDLIGWQTEDIYQKLVITYIYNIKKNINIDQKLFVLPKPN